MSSSERNIYLSICESIDFEKIKDHPNILIAANFWDQDRYHAARTCYKFMRAIDDMIDDFKAQHKVISEDEIGLFESNVNNWLAMMTSSRDLGGGEKELSDVFRNFRLPLWTMQDFARAMIYDIYHDGFATMNTFLEYAGGASVAPASVFVHLAGLQKHNDEYSDPLFDVREAALPCAIFSYLVHIVRDFQKDQLNNLTYFPDDIVIKNGLTRAGLDSVAHGGEITEGFRNIVREYMLLADQYRMRTYEKIKEISPLIGTRYRLSLEIIFELYLMVFERIDIEKGTFTTRELNPTPTEIRDRVIKTIKEFNF